ncbi:MAG: hypothetical protein ABL966_14875 [Acidimicrobiales bacterium]
MATHHGRHRAGFELPARGLDAAHRRPLAAGQVGDGGLQQVQLPLESTYKTAKQRVVDLEAGETRLAWPGGPAPITVR